MEIKMKKIIDFIKEVGKVSKENPDMKRKDVIKLASINIKLKEEDEYSENGPKVNDLIGQNNPDPTY